MKKLLLVSAVTFSGFAALANGSYADINEQMKDSRYCRENSFDIACMGPESLEARKQHLSMTKEKAVESRTRYCRDATPGDPICDEKMMNDTTGY